MKINFHPTFIHWKFNMPPSQFHFNCLLSFCLDQSFTPHLFALYSHTRIGISNSFSHSHVILFHYCMKKAFWKFASNMWNLFTQLKCFLGVPVTEYGGEWSGTRILMWENCQNVQNVLRCRRVIKDENLCLNEVKQFYV
jgi:hypothetical protein